MPAATEHPPGPPSTPRPLAFAALALARRSAPAPRPRSSRRRARGGSKKLSDEVKRFRWAHATQRATAFSRPDDEGAWKTGKLRLLTEDGFPEVYLLLSRWEDEDGNDWVRVRSPRALRPDRAASAATRGATSSAG